MIFTAGAQKMQNPSAPEMQALREKFRNEPWTGALEAEFPTGERVVFLLTEGTMKCCYHLSLNVPQKRDLEEAWSRLLQSPPAVFSFIALEVRSLQLVRILLEHPIPAETLTVDGDRLGRIVEEWTRLSHPSLAVMKWTGGQGLLALWPDPAQALDGVLVSPAGTWQGGDAVTRILSAGLKECEVSRHAFVSDGSAWEGFAFQRVFVRLMEALLVRYKELTGLALLNALDRNINRVAFEHKWKFSITLGSVSDQMLFAELDETLSACKVLLEVACGHIGVVLGQKLLRSLIQDAIALLDPHSIHMIEKYSIDAFLGLPRSSLINGEGTHG